VDFDARFMGFNNEQDAVAIANWLISNGRPNMKIDDVAETFPEWSVRRLNSALSYLEGARAVETRRYVNDKQWTYSAATISDRTVRFVKGRS
jgi:hypothetical protein